MASSSNSPCAACKFLRRKCTQGCVFAPYFPPDNPQKFASVHRVFGASNVAKLLNELPHPHREDAVNSLAYEADARLKDPVYGCVGHISVLQQKVKLIQQDLELARKELSVYMGAAAYAPFLPPYQSMFHPQQQHHHHHHSMAMGLGLGSPQMLIKEQQQQQLMAAAMAAREQEMMLRSFEQQQPQQNSEISNRGLMFSHQVELGGNGAPGAVVVVSGGTGSGGSPSSGLALVSPAMQVFDNPFQIQHQNQHQHRQQQQHNLHLEEYLDQKAVSDEGGSVASAVRHFEI